MTQLPVKLAALFSKKAKVPSLKSEVPQVSAKDFASNSIPSDALSSIDALMLYSEAVIAKGALDAIISAQSIA